MLVLTSSCRGGEDSQAQHSQTPPAANNTVGITLKARGELPALEVAIAPTPAVEAPVFLESVTSTIAAAQSECFADLMTGVVLDWTVYLRDGAVTHTTGPAKTPCLAQKFDKARLSDPERSPEQYTLHIQLRLAEAQNK